MQRREFSRAILILAAISSIVYILYDSVKKEKYFLQSLFGIFFLYTYLQYDRKKTGSAAKEKLKSISLLH